MTAENAGTHPPVPREEAVPLREAPSDESEASRVPPDARSVRHELRTPINQIVGYCDLLADGETDLVLLDIVMSQMSGYEVLQRIKADGSLRHVPVIVISALDAMDSVVRCIEMGAEDYLTKPLDPVLLRARIDASLEKKRLRDQEVRLYDELQSNFRRLKELERLRDDLTHMIIHDLRTPLTSLITGVQTLSILGDLS